MSTLTPEPDDYGLLQEVLFDLRQAERTLALIEETTSDQERALHLEAIRGAIAQMATFVWPVVGALNHHRVTKGLR
jgi:hypothetical protein